MSYTLRINFSGLCMFVPEPASVTNPDRMHVLMPTPRGHASWPDGHVAALGFDTVHLRQKATGGMAFRPLSGYAFKLGGVVRGAELTMDLRIVWEGGHFQGTYLQFIQEIQGRVSAENPLQTPGWDYDGAFDPAFLRQRPFSI